MRDIPIFTTEHGAAGLVLREIPYTGVAYITLHDSLQPDMLIQECVDFCRAAGAEKIYATGHTFLEQFPLRTELWRLQQNRANLPITDAEAHPVTAQTLEFWRTLYNEKMRPVPNSAFMTKADSEKHLQQGTGYYVYREDVLLGIGIASGEIVETVISTKPGAGADVLLALCSALACEQVFLEVASANLPAVRLYEKLGFQKIAKLSSWYTVKE